MALRRIYLYLILTLLVSGRWGVQAEEEEQEQGDEQADAAHVQPRFTSTAGEHTVLMSGTATLPCKVADTGSYAVTWYKVAPTTDDRGNINEEFDPDSPGPTLFVDRTKMSQEPRLQLADNGNENDHSLNIVDVTAYDSGPYECHISTTPPTVQRQILKVNVPPQVTIEPDSSPYSVEPGQTLTLTCNGAGFPQPDVVWSRQGGPLPDGRASHKAKGKAEIFYDTVSVNHSGIYHCTADNGVGDPASANIEVDVISKDSAKHTPTIRTDRKFIPVLEGQNISLSFNYSANPLPQVHWFFERFQVHPLNQQFQGRISQNFSQPIPGHDMWTATMIISNIRETDFGDYGCRITNNLGEAEETIHVTGKPGPAYTFEAAVYGNRIDFYWQLESAPDITGYKLFYRKPNADFSKWVDLAGHLGHRVKNNEWAANFSWPLNNGLLKPNTDYQFGIQGVNQYGDGSLQKPPLDVRTPLKFEGVFDDEAEIVKTTDDDKEMNAEKMKEFEGKHETFKSVKAGNTSGAGKLELLRRTIGLTIISPMLLAWYLRTLA